ncbi:phage tail tape measure protein [Flintibacter muris]|uniref:phage tail tape measure protein n=1 Tax=Flintibacter muris TaxID=2941327 RepID=UPI00203CB21A|nr:phage tail tape measure protein [Flintibacter muris]
MPDVDGQIVLGLDIARTTEQMSQDLNRVLTNIGKKEITLSAKIDNIRSEQITSQINNIAKQLNQSLTVKDIKINVGLEQSNIERIRQELSGLKISDSGAKELTKEFTSMNVALEKVQHKWVEVKKAEDDGTESTQKLLNLMIQGSTEQGKLVSVTKQFNVETGKVVRTQTAITDNLKAQQREQDALAKKAQADNDARIKYLSQQKSLLKDIASAYTTSPKSVKDDSHLKALEKQYQAIKIQIEQLESADGALSQKQKSNISSQISDLKRLAKEYQNAEYVATQLRTKDITPIKEEQLSKLSNFEKELDRSNILTGEFKNKITELTGVLSNAFDQKSLTAFLNSFDLLKLDAQAVKQEMSGLEAQFKLLQTVDNKIANLQKQKIHTQVDSNEYNAINQQLQQQYTIRRQITAEIERTAAVHPELIQQSQELSKYFQQSHENAAKLAQEEAKVADQIAKTANAYRSQAKTNGLENSISALEAKFLSLKNVSSSAATTMQNEFANLRSLAETIATSTDNSKVISAYNQYDEAIKRTSNSLDILARQSKTAEQATREHEQAVKDDAAAQLTLTRSSTLSNTIESWMNQNTKAAQAYGDKLREIQSILANNTNPAMLANARAEFAKIKSEAKAAGLITNQFATSIKNTTLQLLGLTSGVMVLRKIISLIKEGVDTVVELDTALVDLQKTTTMSGSDLASFYKEANDAAKELGVTTKDIIQSAADWSRLGYSDKTSSKMMAKLAAQFAAISPGVDIGTATTGLVSVMKAYGIEAENVLDGVMSKINIVGNTAATSNAEIINGLQNSASAMAAMNSTLDENIALFTAAQEITQDDSKVGNALRSISMRVRGYDEETGELSEELANITGEVYDLTKATEDSQGVSLFTDETQEHYKSIYQYLKDISEVYDDLGEKQQQQLMEKLFGKNRASVGQAILQNFEAAEKAMQNMTNSAGNADAEMEVITKSLEFKLNALKETGVGIFQDMFKREEVGAVIDMLTTLLGLFGKLTAALGPFGTALAGVGIVAFVKNLD